ncbi:MAG: pyrimidine 5'-nucleotidase [Alphaproteobacteria bacterium]
MNRPSSPLPDSATEAWVFDLDNTLYPAACDLFAQVNARMAGFIANQLGLDPVTARHLQKRYFHEHGTTLRGLMLEHGTDPTAYLAYVHDIDLSPVRPDPRLDRALARLPGRKVVFTNGSVRHAENVMARLGVSGHFDAVFDIVAADYIPKPAAATYRRMATALAIAPDRAVMIDDIPQNLVPAAAMGMTTVWVRTDTEYARIGEVGKHVHHIADDLAAWLEHAAAALAPPRP